MTSVTHATAQGNRDYQEDRVIVAVVPEGSLLAVADGHGGSEASEYVSKNLFRIWAETWADSSDPFAPNPEGFIRAVFLKLAQETAHMYAGTTLSLALVNGIRAFLAVLGDSPIIFSTVGDGPWIAPDHNARDNDEERAAAEARGAFYADGYLWGRGMNSKGLQMSRALGDTELRFLNDEPEIFIKQIKTPAWLLVASDGLIDPTHRGTGGYDAVIDLLNHGAEAKQLVDRAVRLQTNDNASAIVWRNK